MHCFAPIADSLVAEQATVAIRLFATRTHDNPDAKAAGDEALQKHYHDGRTQEAVPAPRRRVRPYQPIIDSGLVKARRFPRGELMERRRAGCRLERSNPGLVIEQRRLCCLRALGCRGHLVLSHAQLR
jgi:hypothetical protein